VNKILPNLFSRNSKRLMATNFVSTLCFGVARWFVFIPTIPMGYILEGLGMENASLFFEHLEYFTAIW
jgi:hypothetical protein